MGPVRVETIATIANHSLPIECLMKEFSNMCDRLRASAINHRHYQEMETKIRIATLCRSAVHLIRLTSCAFDQSGARNYDLHKYRDKIALHGKAQIRKRNCARQ